MTKREMFVRESKTVTEYVRFLYDESMREYNYSRDAVASRAIIAPSTVWRVIGETKPDELARWDSILNILFCAGVDQKQLRELNWMYRHALIVEGVPLKTRSPATAETSVAKRRQDPSTDSLGPFSASVVEKLIREDR